MQIRIRIDQILWIRIRLQSMRIHISDCSKEVFGILHLLYALQEFPLFETMQTRLHR